MGDVFELRCIWWAMKGNIFFEYFNFGNKLRNVFNFFNQISFAQLVPDYQNYLFFPLLFICM